MIKKQTPTVEFSRGDWVRHIPTGARGFLVPSEDTAADNDLSIAVWAGGGFIHVGTDHSTIEHV